MTLRVRILALLVSGALVGGCASGSSSSSTSGTTTSAATGSTSSASASATTTAGQVGFEGVPIEPGAQIAPASTTGTGKVHGITCGSSEQLAYHIHAHLALYVNGQARALPGGIGIPGSRVQSGSQGPVAAGGQCIYWLHTHAPDGIIHVESPTRRIYTLGEFFDEWNQPLSASAAGNATGTVHAFLNGRAWSGDPRAIPLKPHAVIQLDLGSPSVPFRAMSWSNLSL